MINTIKLPISSLIIATLLTGWMISDSRFDLAMDVHLASVKKDLGEEADHPEVTPNSTTPDIPTNWFTATASVSHQLPSSHNANNNNNAEDDDVNSMGKVIVAGSGDGQ